ncbi:MAG: PAC2 family protein [Ilumatobacteraceae bacterium]
MSALVQWYEQRPVRTPVLVVMLSGWIDTSGAAAAAMTALEHTTSATTLARFDRDTFIDYRNRRPTMEIRDGVNSRLVWPDIELKAGVDLEGRDVLLLSGHEPDACWETFTNEVVRIATQLGVRQLVGLGAYPFAAPHSRPVRLSTTSPSAELTDALPYLRSSLDVPAGISAVLEHAFHAEKIPALTLWAQVPHYVNAMSYPAASCALVDALCHVAGIDVEPNGLRGEAIMQRQRLDDLVASNDEHADMVRKLERHYDALLNSMAETTHPSLSDGNPMNVDELPSAEELAEELEQYLRDQGPA